LFVKSIYPLGALSTFLNKSQMSKRSLLYAKIAHKRNFFWAVGCKFLNWFCWYIFDKLEVSHILRLGLDRTSLRHTSVESLCTFTIQFHLPIRGSKLWLNFISK